MKQYLDMLRYVLENGVDKMDRTGVGTRSVFGQQMRFDLSRGFPLMTTKKMHLKSIIPRVISSANGSPMPHAWDTIRFLCSVAVSWMEIYLS